MMKVIICGSEVSEFNLNASSMKEILSLLKLQKGKEWTDSLMNEKHKFILGKEGDWENMVALTPEVVFSDFKEYDHLFIVPEVSGEEPISFTLLIQAIVAYASTALIYVAASFAINMVMSLLSPTPEFTADPAKNQEESKAFSGAPIIRNQGCSVPLVFGNPYCGGVLISSGLFTEEGMS